MCHIRVIHEYTFQNEINIGKQVIVLKVPQKDIQGHIQILIAVGEKWWELVFKFLG
jgi:hypothetical protein